MVVAWRSFSPGSTYAPDLIADVTALLHDAYAQHLANGLDFSAATQDKETTRNRLTSATALIGFLEDAVVATGLIYERLRARPDLPSWFSEESVSVAAQLAVLPRLQRLGIGSELLGALERQAKDWGKLHLALDTAEPALALISFYKKRGYVTIDHFQYSDVPFRHVILSKTLT
ncbi:MAG: GNAT family N-acetyltransferase [Vulcanimicrobiaceae bacterium]